MLQLELAMGGMAAVLILVDMRCRGAALVLNDGRNPGSDPGPCRTG